MTDRRTWNRADELHAAQSAKGKNSVQALPGDATEVTTKTARLLSCPRLSYSNLRKRR